MSASFLAAVSMRADALRAPAQSGPAPALDRRPEAAGHLVAGMNAERGGDFAAAVELYAKAAAVFEELGADGAVGAAQTYHNMAGVYARGLNNCGRALELHGKALAVWNWKRLHDKQAKTLHDMGVCNVVLINDDEALRLFGLALGSKRELLGEQSASTGQTYFMMATVYGRNDNFEGARGLFGQALLAFEASQQPSQVAMVKSRMAELERRRSEHDERA